MSPISHECWNSNRLLFEAMMRDNKQRPPKKSSSPLAHNNDSNPPDPTGHSSPEDAPASLFALSTQARHRPSTMSTPQAAAAQRARASQIPSEPDEDQLLYYVRRPTAAQGRTLHKSCPAFVTISLPPLAKPTNPEARRQVLRHAKAEVYVVAYGCGCQNMGTCIHYQFAFNRSNLPDGLICDLCGSQQTAREVPRKLIRGRRACPEHQVEDGMETNHVDSRPEDFLATAEQVARYQELMLRSMNGDWTTVPQQVVERRRAVPTSRRRARSSAAHRAIRPTQQSVDPILAGPPSTPTTLPSSALRYDSPRLPTSSSAWMMPAMGPLISPTERRAFMVEGVMQAQSQLRGSNNEFFSAEPEQDILDRKIFGFAPPQNEYDDTGLDWKQQDGMEVSAEDMRKEFGQRSGQGVIEDSGEAGKQFGEANEPNVRRAPGEVIDQDEAAVRGEFVYANLRNVEAGQDYKFNWDDFPGGLGQLG